MMVTTHDYRIAVYWLGRDFSSKATAHALYMFMTALRGVDEAFGDFQRFDKARNKCVAVASKDDCLTAIEAGGRAWRTGPTERTAYKVQLHLGERSTAAAQLSLTCGIDVRDIGPVYMPNSLSLTMARYVATAGLTPGMLLNGLRAAVNAFRPDFGFVGTSDCPQPPQPLFSEGTPPVGWMTFLSASYPPLPVSFAEPTRIYNVGKQGHIIVAHPYMFDVDDEEQREAVTAVAAALHEGGVLLPAAECAAG